MTVYTSAQCLVCIVLRSWSKYGLCAGVNVLLSHYNAKEWSYVASSMDVLMMLTAWNYQVPFFLVRLMETTSFPSLCIDDTQCIRKLIHSLKLGSSIALMTSRHLVVVAKNGKGTIVLCNIKESAPFFALSA